MPRDIAVSPPTCRARPQRRRWIWQLLIVSLLLGAGGWFWHDRQGPRHWRQAQAAITQHDLHSAATHLERYLEYRPNEAAALLLAARTARRLGNYSQAEALLIRCQNLSSVTKESRLEWDLLRVQQGDLGEVHARLRATIGPDHPDASLVLEALARGYLQSDRLLDALEACNLAIARQPEQLWPWLWRGRTYERITNSDLALADYQQALELAPDNKEVRLALGTLLAERRQPGEAAAHFQYVLERFPQEQEALLGLAACHIEQGQPEAAVPLLKLVIERKPSSARALVLLGSAALQQADPAGAENWLKQAIEQAPDHTEAFHQLILALRSQGKQEEADRLANRLEELRKDIDRLEDLIQAISRQPESAALRHEAGSIALRLGREELGVQWLESALQATGDHRASHVALAEYYSQRDDPRAEHHRRLAETP